MPEGPIPGQAEFGNQQAAQTMNRAAYGNQAAQMMGGSEYYGGAAQGLNNMASDIGSAVKPVGYTPPARVHTGYYGRYAQETSLTSGAAGQIGLGPQVPRGTTALEYHQQAGADFGERVGTGVSTAGSMAAGTAGSAAGAYVGSAAGGYAGSAVGAAIGSAAGPVGTAVGAGAGALVGKGVGMIAGGIAGWQAGPALNESVSQRREIQSFLESTSDRFAGTGSDLSTSKTGSGLGRDSRRNVANFLKQQDIEDPTMGTGEMAQVMESGVTQGLFNGTQDMEEFKKKFKDIKEGAKEVMKTLHTTLEEGMKTIKELKASGVDPSQVKEITQQAESAGQVTGRTASEMLDIGKQGAELFRGTGVDMEIGMKANMMNLESVRAARDAGAISQEAINQAGGEEQMAQRMTARGLQFSQSQFGRGTNAAFFQAGAGGGGFDKGDFLSTMTSGGPDFLSQSRQAAGNLSSPASLMEYEANQEKFVSEMGDTFGGQGLQIAQMQNLGGYAEYLSERTGADKQTAFRFAGKRMMGLSGKELDRMEGQMESAEQTFQARMEGARATKRQAETDAAYRSNIFNFAKESIKDTVKDFTQPITEFSNRVIDKSAQMAEAWRQENLLGRTRVEEATVVDEAFTGLENQDRGRATTEAEEAGGRPYEDTDRQARLDFGFELAGGTSRGDQIQNLIEEGKLDHLGLSQEDTKIGGEGIILQESATPDGEGGYMHTTISEKKLKEAAQKASQSVFTRTLGQAEKAKEEGQLKDVEGGLGRALVEGVSSIEDFGEGDLDTLAKKAFSGVESAEDLTAEQHDKLKLQVQGTRYEQAFTERAQANRTLEGAGRDATVAKLKAVSEEKESTLDDLKNRIGVDDASSETMQLVAGAVLNKAQGNEEKARELRKKAAARAAEEGGQDTVQQINEVFTRENEEGQKEIKEGIKKASDKLRDQSMRQRDLQEEAGTNTLAEGILGQLDKRGEGVKQELKDRVRGAADTLKEQGIMGLSDKEVEALKETGVGSAVVNQKQNIKKIQDMEIEGESLSEEQEKKATRILGEAGIEGSERQRLIERLEKGEKAAVVDQISKKIPEMVGEGDKALGPDSTGTEGEEQQGTAQEQFEQQVAINSEILAAMQGLAARLNVNQ